MNLLPYCFENGIGLDKYNKQAVDLYQNAANTGREVTMFNLGLCYEFGRGINYDMKRALELYNISSALGCYNTKIN
jgi:uncharacterized protein